GQSREEKAFISRNHPDRLETVPASLQLCIAVQRKILFRTLSRLPFCLHQWSPAVGDGKSNRNDFSRGSAKRGDTHSSFRVTQCRRIDKFDFLHLPAHSGGDDRTQSFELREHLLHELGE